MRKEKQQQQKWNHNCKGKFLHGVNKSHSEPRRVLLNTEAGNARGLGVDWATEICRT